MNWTKVKEYEDIFYEKSDGIAKVTINRPHKRNAFRPLTVFEMFEAFTDAREDSSVGVVLLTELVSLMASMLFALVVTNPFEVRLATLVEMVFKIECFGSAKIDSLDAQGCYCSSIWICNRRWTRASRNL